MDKKVKLYNLLNLTKKQYLCGQLVAAVLLITFWVWAIIGDFNEFLFGYGIVILAVATLGEIIETYITLMKFHNKS